MNIDILLERIDHLCIQKGVNKTKAFIDSGVGKDFAYNLKRSAPSAEKIAALAAYFEVSVDYLLGISDNINGGNGENLNDYEMRLLNAFRSLPKDERLIWLGKFELLAAQTAEREYKKSEA